MSRIALGLFCGIVFGAVSVATMIPLPLKDKKIAMAGAFVNRFAIGLVTGATTLPLPIWGSGLLFGLLLSLPDAIITKSWIPIMVLGAIGGLACGVVIGAFGV
jgi:hydrogenase/urease accessory protein HupE